VTDKLWLDCCRGNGCPQVSIEGETVWVKDDEGSIVTMSVDQLLDVARTVRETSVGLAGPVED